MALITIGNVALPEPTSYAVSFSDIDSSDTGRTENGVMYRDRIRQGVAKIQASWEMLTQTECDIILNAVTPDSFTVTYFGGSATATMYAGDRSLTLRCIDGYGAARWDFSVNLIEF